MEYDNDFLESHILVTTESDNVIQQENGSVLLQNIISKECSFYEVNETLTSYFHLQVDEPEQIERETEEVSDPEGTPNGCGEDPEPNEKNQKWNDNSTVCLLDIIKDADGNKAFESGLKKNVWIQIAKKLTKELGKSFEAHQVESKWKSLKRTYKSVLTNNQMSGKKRRHWEYFNLIHTFMFRKPEITPAATCSNIAGLTTADAGTSSNSAIGNTETANTTKQVDSDTNLHESSFSRKRKSRRNEATERHNDKMARLDRFNDLFERMINKM